VSTFAIRQYGDPVLRQRTAEVDGIDGSLVRLVEDMIETMKAAPGSGLAANQVGVQRRIFVYDVGEGPRAVINPAIVESAGEWTYDEGCLSIPGLNWPIVRPNQVHLRGIDLEGNELSIEAETLEGRVFQHEIDHLDGILLVERLDADQRREALRILRSRALGLDPRPAAGRAADPDGLGTLLTN
jgi:peptide deformylase